MQGLFGTHEGKYSVPIKCRVHWRHRGTGVAGAIVDKSGARPKAGGCSGAAMVGVDWSSVEVGFADTTGGPVPEASRLR